MPAWSESPWKAGIADVTRLVYDRGAWAVIGGVDGTTTHLAVQLALKSPLPAAEPRQHRRHGRPRERAVALLAAAVGRRDRAGAGRRRSRRPRAGGPVRGRRRDRPRLARDARRAAPRARRAAAHARRRSSSSSPLEPDLPALAGRLLRGGPRALVVLAPSSLAGRLVAALRAAGFRGHDPRRAPAGRAAFRRAAGAAAEGVIAPLLVEPRAGVGRVRAGVRDALGRAARRGRRPTATTRCASSPRRCAGPASTARASATRCGRSPRGRARRAPCPGTRSGGTNGPWPSAPGPAVVSGSSAVPSASRLAGRRAIRRPAAHEPVRQRAARRRTASTGPPASRGGRISRPPFASRSFSAVAKSILRCGRRAVPPGSVPRSRSVMTAG